MIVVLKVLCSAKAENGMASIVPPTAAVGRTGINVNVELNEERGKRAVLAESEEKSTFSRDKRGSTRCSLLRRILNL